MKCEKINIQLKNKQAIIKEFEIIPEDAELIIEALRFYQLNSAYIEKEMLEKGCIRLRDQAYYLKSDIQTVLEKLQ